MTELKPCPFCGENAKVGVYIGIAQRYAVYCDSLKCPVKPKTKSFITREEAVDTWNRRADNG